MCCIREDKKLAPPDLYKLDAYWTMQNEFKTLLMDTSNVSYRRQEVEMLVSPDERTYPVCGKLDGCVFCICPVCGWRNDVAQVLDKDYKNGANTMSLNEARKAWEERKEII